MPRVLGLQNQAGVRKTGLCSPPPHQPCVTSEDLPGWRQCPHHCEGGEVGPVLGSSLPCSPGAISCTGALGGGGVVLALGIYENQTLTSPVGTSGLSRDAHCPHAGGSGAPAGRPRPIHPTTLLLRPPTRPPPATLPGPPPPAPGDASARRGFRSLAWSLLRETRRPRTLAPNAAAASQLLTPLGPKARQSSRRHRRHPEAASSSGGRRTGSC